MYYGHLERSVLHKDKQYKRNVVIQKTHTFFLHKDKTEGNWPAKQLKNVQW